MKTIVFLLSVVCFSFMSWSQTPIDIYEATMKVPAFGEETYLCGLAEGDQLIVNFKEIYGKELKEFEILEYPLTSKYQNYKINKLENQIINISKTGIYKFRFTNGALGRRICNFKVQRIPASEATIKFNTSVYYGMVSDTTITNITEQVAKVHSQLNANGNRTAVDFTLPKNIVAWSYYIGVDQAGQQSIIDATKKIAETDLFYRLTGYNPVAAVALNLPSFITKLQKGEDIDFAIVDDNNLSLFSAGQAYNCYKKGKVLNDFSRMTEPNRGTYHICLYNDNAVTGVTVIVKVTAISVITHQVPHLEN
jgi:hypothetical protein